MHTAKNKTKQTHWQNNSSWGGRTCSRTVLPAKTTPKYGNAYHYMMVTVLRKTFCNIITLCNSSRTNGPQSLFAMVYPSILIFQLFLNFT
jgi:hypothetical protein